MQKVTHGRGYIYSIQYHIVWCVKYRHKILKGDIEERLKELLYKIANENNFTIRTMESNLDHIHLLIDCSPQHFIPNIIKALKGVNDRRMFQYHPELKKKLWGGHLWNPSYFVTTVSENTREQIVNYINTQRKGR